MARREKKPVHHVQMTEGKREIIQRLLQDYDIESAQDIQDALKDLLGGTIKEMLEAEMDDHLGYGRCERADRSQVDDYRNGTKPNIKKDGEIRISAGRGDWNRGTSKNHHGGCGSHTGRNIGEQLPQGGRACQFDGFRKQADGEKPGA